MMEFVRDGEQEKEVGPSDDEGNLWTDEETPMPVMTGFGAPLCDM
jgi:hypothetical protein